MKIARYVLLGVVLYVLAVGVVFIIIRRMVNTKITSYHTANTKIITPEVVQPDKPVMVLATKTVTCAFCGRIISKTTKKIEVPSSKANSPREETNYSVCSAKRCHKAAALAKKYPLWSFDDYYAVAGRRVHIGMTKEQAIAAWGRPHQINRTTGGWGTSEQWCYGEIGGSYLYFDGDGPAPILRTP